MSHYIQGQDRKQTRLLPPSIEDYVDDDAPVRFIDAYVDGLNLVRLGFTKTRLAATGRPPYDPACLLKLYVYGYLNRVSSSRRLERECHLNLEVIWLMGELRPDFKTISDFRRDNSDGLTKIFKQFNLLCRELGLFGAELVAIDGSKFKALNSPDGNFNKHRLEKAMERIEQGIAAHLKRLETTDEQEPGGSDRVENLKERLIKLRERQQELQQMQEKLGDDENAQMSENDPDSRMMVKVKVGYNAQIAVDSKHHLIAAQDVCQDANDFGQLAPMAEAAKNALETPSLSVVADSGYEAADQLEQCEQGEIEAIVPPKKNPSGRTNRGEKVYPKERFKYDKAADCYQCPGNQLLSFTRPDKKKDKLKRRYENPEACAHCPLKKQCTTMSHRVIVRLSNEEVVERSRQRAEQRKETIRQRGSIVEHPFGTLKNWGYGSFSVTTLKKVRGEFSLMCLSYNLRRALNLIGVKQLLAKLRWNDCVAA